MSSCSDSPERRKSLTCSTAASTPRPPKRQSKGGLAALPPNFLLLVARFAELLSAEPTSPTSPKDEAPHVSCVLMLLACGYEESDIVACVATAAANILRQENEFKQMGDRERAFLASIHLYLAHVFIFDECVQLKFWHEWAFHNYCSFGCLNRTVGKLLRLMNYRAVVEPDIVLHNIAYFNGEEDTARGAPLRGKW